MEDVMNDFGFDEDEQMSGMKFEVLDCSDCPDDCNDGPWE